MNDLLSILLGDYPSPSAKRRIVWVASRGSAQPPRRPAV